MSSSLIPKLLERRKKFRSDLAQQSDLTLTVILVAAGLVFIGIGLFSHNIVFKAAAAAYAILP